MTIQTSTATALLLVSLVACKNDDPTPKAELEQSPASATPANESAGVASTAPAPAGPTASAVSNSAKKPALNVVLLTIDSMRAHMPWTGYERDIAPNLTELAKQSVNYTHAYAVSTSTAKSAPAILTGRYPSAIYRSGYFFAAFSDANLFFTEVLQEKGIVTLGGHGHGYFDPAREKGLNQGFDVWRITPGIDFDNTTDKHVTSDKMTDMAIDMLKQPKPSTGQFFMWLHYMDPHDQYIQHASTPVFGKRARDRYDSEVLFTDQHVGRLLDYLRQQPYWGNTAIIVSADHGEAFGEHDMYKHGFELWEVITRVPLLVYAPGASPRTIEQRRSHIDLAPTILDLMGIEQHPKSFQGRSFAEEIFGAEPDNREPILLDLPEDHDTLDRRAVIKDGYKLIVKSHGHTLHLFNLDEDPDEKTDLAAKEPEKLKQMRAIYDEMYKKIEPIAPYGGMKQRGGGKADGPMGP